MLHGLLTKYHRPWSLEISHFKWLILESCSFISLLIEIQILYRNIDENFQLLSEILTCNSLHSYSSIKKISRRKWTTRIYKIGDPRTSIFADQPAFETSGIFCGFLIRTHRVGVFGFWALLICFFASSMELFLGISFWFILTVTIRDYPTVGSLPPSYELAKLFMSKQKELMHIKHAIQSLLYSVDAKNTNFRLTSGLQNLENFMSGFHA